MPERIGPLSPPQRKKIHLIRAAKDAGISCEVEILFTKRLNWTSSDEFYAHFGFVDVKTFSLHNNCEQVLTAFEQLQETDNTISVPPPYIKVLRPMTKFRHSPQTLAAIAHKVNNWSDNEVRAVIGRTIKKAITKKHLLKIAEKAEAVLPFLKFGTQPYEQICQILALCGATEYKTPTKTEASPAPKHSTKSEAVSPGAGKLNAEINDGVAMVPLAARSGLAKDAKAKPLEYGSFQKSGGRRRGRRHPDESTSELNLEF